MIICSNPECQTTAGCQCNNSRVTGMRVFSCNETKWRVSDHICAVCKEPLLTCTEGGASQLHGVIDGSVLRGGQIILPGVPYHYRCKP